MVYFAAKVPRNREIGIGTFYSHVIAREPSVDYSPCKKQENKKKIKSLATVEAEILAIF